MPQWSSIFPSIFICLIIFVIVTTPAFSVDSGTHWLLVDATPAARAYEQLNSLTELLTSRGEVPSEQIYHVEGENATTEEIYALLQEIGRQAQAQDTLIFLYHGMVSKPNAPTMQLEIQEAEDGIQDSTLNRWFSRNL